MTHVNRSPNTALNEAMNKDWDNQTQMVDWSTLDFDDDELEQMKVVDYDRRGEQYPFAMNVGANNALRNKTNPGKSKLRKQRRAEVRKKIALENDVLRTEITSLKRKQNALQAESKELKLIIRRINKQVSVHDDADAERKASMVAKQKNHLEAVMVKQTAVSSEIASATRKLNANRIALKGNLKSRATVKANMKFESKLEQLSKRTPNIKFTLGHAVGLESTGVALPKTRVVAALRDPVTYEQNANLLLNAVKNQKTHGGRFKVEVSEEDFGRGPHLYLSVKTASHQGGGVGRLVGQHVDMPGGKAWNPSSENNDCGVRCVLYCLNEDGVSYDESDIDNFRKENRIIPDVPIEMADLMCSEYRGNKISELISIGMLEGERFVCADPPRNKWKIALSNGHYYVLLGKWDHNHKVHKGERKKGTRGATKQALIDESNSHEADKLTEAIAPPSDNDKVEVVSSGELFKNLRGEIKHFDCDDKSELAAFKAYTLGNYEELFAQFTLGITVANTTYNAVDRAGCRFFIVGRHIMDEPTKDTRCLMDRQTPFQSRNTKFLSIDMFTADEHCSKGSFTIPFNVFYDVITSSRFDVANKVSVRPLATRLLNNVERVTDGFVKKGVDIEDTISLIIACVTKQPTVKKTTIGGAYMAASPQYIYNNEDTYHTHSPVISSTLALRGQSTDFPALIGHNDYTTVCMNTESPQESYELTYKERSMKGSVPKSSVLMKLISKLIGKGSSKHIHTQVLNAAGTKWFKKRQFTALDIVAHGLKLISLMITMAISIKYARKKNQEWNKLAQEVATTGKHFKWLHLIPAKPVSILAIACTNLGLIGREIRNIYNNLGWKHEDEPEIPLKVCSSTIPEITRNYQGRAWTQLS